MVIKNNYGRGKCYILTNQVDERFCLHFFWKIVLNFEEFFLKLIGGFTKIKVLIILQKLKQNFMLTKNGEQKIFVHCIWVLYTESNVELCNWAIVELWICLRNKKSLTKLSRFKLTQILVFLCFGYIILFYFYLFMSWSITKNALLWQLPLRSGGINQ